jgi:hypothetical protein
MELKQLYEWGDPIGLIKVRSGYMEFGKWLEKECERLDLPDRTVEIRTSKSKGVVRHGLFINFLCQEHGCRQTATKMYWCEEHASENLSTR